MEQALWMANVVHTVYQLVISIISHDLPFKFTHSIRNKLHAIIVVPACLLRPCSATLGWYGDKLTANLTEHVDRVVVVVDW
jgi:hypothetical protein